MSEQESEDTNHPTAQRNLLEQEESSWPKRIGLFSLIYAFGGLLCQAALGVMPFVLGKFMGSQINVPTAMKVSGGALAVVFFVIGLTMLVGSIRLLQRKRSGFSLLRTWSVLRLAMVLVVLIVAILTAPAQIQITKSILEQSNKNIREAGQGSKLNKINDEEIRSNVMRNAVIRAGVFTIYPLFLGFYLSRKKITEEVNTW